MMPPALGTWTETFEHRHGLRAIETPTLAGNHVDIETGARERRIEPVLPLEDDVLASFAGSVLGEPSLDATRILEPYVEAILERGRA